MQSRVSIGHVMVKVRSTKQIEASQKNGLKGGGPVTPTGKLRSSMNAFKHGGYAHQFVTLGEDPKEFEVFYQAIFDYVQPENILDEDVVEQFIFCAWKQKRLVIIETASLSTEMLDYYRSDLRLDYRKTRKISKTYLAKGKKTELEKNEELLAIAFKLDVNSHQSLVVLEEIQTRTFSKYQKLLEKILEIKERRRS
jgi:hypothetical protein